MSARAAHACARSPWADLSIGSVPREALGAGSVAPTSCTCPWAAGSRPSFGRGCCRPRCARGLLLVPKLLGSLHRDLATTFGAAREGRTSHRTPVTAGSSQAPGWDGLGGPQREAAQSPI